MGAGSGSGERERGAGAASGGGAGGGLPLSGIRVLVTRPERQALEMVEALRAVGAEPVRFPLIRVAKPADGGAALRTTATRLASFDWVVVSSANGVDALAVALADAAGGQAPPVGRAPGPGSGPLALLAAGPRFACVGPGTAAALRRHGVEPAVVAGRNLAEGLLEALPLDAMRGRKVLLPLAADARPVLADGLREAGADVELVEAYRTVADGRGAEEVRERLERGEIDVLTFTSSSAVERFVDVLGMGTVGALVAVIGPVTAGTAETLGMPPQVVAAQHTIPGLIDALVDYYDSNDRSKQP